MRWYRCYECGHTCQEDDCDVDDGELICPECGGEMMEEDFNPEYDVCEAERELERRLG